MRLTKKHILMQSRSLADNEEEYQKHEQADLEYRKLWELENIEEKLGVDLILYLKMCVVPSDVYLKSEKGVLVLKNIKFAYVAGKFWAGSLIDTSLSPKEYGKTWAFTKEDLECI